MATDDERREVAERLRECRGGWSSGECYYAIIHALGLPDTSRDDGGSALYAALADLIDPDEPSGHECVPGECPLNVRHDNDFIDREALLALADKLDCDGECDGCDMSDGIWCDAQGYAARRIREACGEAVRNG